MTCDSSSLSDRDEMSLNHWAEKRPGAPGLFGRSPLRPSHLPVASHQSVYKRPSPKKAAIKSPWKTATGLDSHKLEQNNLFLLLSLPSFLPVPLSPLPRLPSVPVPIRPSSSAAAAGASGAAASHAARLVCGRALY